MASSNSCFHSSMGARRHRQEGALAPSGRSAPSGNVKCFVHRKTLSRLIIYALFSQSVNLPTGAPRATRAPSLGPCWGLSSPGP